MMKRVRTKDRTLYVQMITTVEKEEDARRISDHLIEERLAACVQIVGPITSNYRWKGRIETVSERLLLIKTRKSLCKKAEKAIRALHPYEVPEIIALPIIAGSRDYLEWIGKETGK